MLPSKSHTFTSGYVNATLSYNESINEAPPLQLDVLPLIPSAFHFVSHDQTISRHQLSVTCATEEWTAAARSYTFKATISRCQLLLPSSALRCLYEQFVRENPIGPCLLI